MESITVEQLLAELDKLNHPQRVQRMAKLGHAHARTAELDRLIQDLMAYNTHYEGTLALTAAIHSRNELRLMDLTKHSSAQVSQLASKAAGTHVKDEVALRAAVFAGSVVVRRGILTGLVRARRAALADALFPEVVAQFDVVEILELLKIVSSDVLHQAIADMGQRVHFWHHLAHAAPDVVLQVIEKDVTARPVWERVSRLNVFGAAFPELAVNRTAQVLRLIKVCQFQELPHCLQKCIPALIRRDVNGVFDMLMLLNVQHRLPASLLKRRRLRMFSQEQLEQLVLTARLSPRKLTSFLSALPPSQRGAMLVVARAGLDVSALPWDQQLILTLARGTVRDAEVERVSQLDKVRDNRINTLRLLAARPYSQAVKELKTATRASAAEDRIVAWQLLISCAAINRDADALNDVLKHAYGFRNEQDPVLQTIYAALQDVPMGMWQDSHVPALQLLVENALQAPDLSSVGRLQLMLSRILLSGSADTSSARWRFALDQMQQVAERMKSSIVLPTFSRLPRGTEHSIYAALAPLVRRAMEHDDKYSGRLQAVPEPDPEYYRVGEPDNAWEREDFFDRQPRTSWSLITLVVDAFGKRAWNIPELQKTVGDIAKLPLTGLPLSETRGFINMWLKDHTRRDERVRDLLDSTRDGWTVFLEHPTVLDHVLRRRQEYLDALLAQQVRMRPGRGERRAAYGWNISGGFHRWLPRQQQQYFLQFVKKVYEDEGTVSLSHRAQMLSQASKLFTTTVADMAPALAEDSKENSLLYETALRVLGRLDGSDDAIFDYFFKHLADDHAKVAAFALGRRLLRIERASLSTYIARALAVDNLKITVRKTMFRLVVETAVPEALQMLQTEIHRPKVHRDVRIAALKTIRSSTLLLRQQATWTMLHDAAADRELDDNIAFALLREVDPLQFSEENRVKYARVLYALVRHNSRFVHDEIMNVLPNWTQFIAGEVMDEIADMICNPAETRAESAIRMLLSCLHHDNAVRVMVRVAQVLSSGAIPAAHNATAQYDLPMRQRVSSLIHQLQDMPFTKRNTYSHVLQAVADVFAANPEYWHAYVSLRLSVLKVDNQYVEALIALAKFVSGLSPSFVHIMCEQVASVFASGVSFTMSFKVMSCRWSYPEALESAVVLKIAEELSRQPAASCRLLALAVLPAVAASNGGAGWSDSAANVLRQLRADSDVSVRFQAMQTFVNR